jgi:hypothetical protein
MGRIDEHPEHPDTYHSQHKIIFLCIDREIWKTEKHSKQNDGFILLKILKIETFFSFYTSREVLKILKIERSGLFFVQQDATVVFFLRVPP